MPLTRVLTPLALLLASASLAADPCATVAEDTVAEMRAGAGAAWNADMERAVRAAAGSACVKAQSERYQPAAESTSPPSGGMAEEAVVGGAAAADAGEARPVPAGQSEAAPDDDDKEGVFSIGGLKFRGAAGSPSQKPYERIRDGEGD